MFTVFDDKHFMKEALKQAQLAMDEDEIPVGAVVVSDNRIIARAHNNTEQLHDVTAHAEIIAITAASDYLGSKYLKGCTLFVTLEPCLMCAGALRWSQIDRMVYAAPDEKHGFMRYGKGVLHPSTTLAYGILQDESSRLLRTFFQNKRTIDKLI